MRKIITLGFWFLCFASPDLSASDFKSDADLLKAARKIHQKSILVDGHNDITWYMTDAGYDLGQPSLGLYHTDMDRLKKGGVDALFFSIWIDPAKFATNGAAARALKMIDSVHQAVERHPNRLTMATSVADIERAAKKGMVAALLGIEGGYAIEDSLELLRMFHRVGVRYLTLTHTRSTSWAGSTARGPGTGLTDFGREVVREMNRLGMLVDVSHVSDQTMHDVLDVARVPVIASHSSVRAICPVPRNIPDPLLQRIAKNGGVVMVNFYNGFLDTNHVATEERFQSEIRAVKRRFSDDLRSRRQAENELAATFPPVPLARLGEHIDHIVRVAGIDHVGLGSDFDGVESTPAGMEDVSCFPNLTVELLRRGYSEREIRKILGGNFLRAFREAEKFAEKASR